jgi:hypothetical protein
MDNFQLYDNVENEDNLLVVMKTYEAPLQFLKEIGDELKSRNYEGKIIIDQLLHSGNTEERFIICSFSNNSFI